MHLAMIHKLINKFQPGAVIMDPITNLSIVASHNEVKSVLMRLVDFFKNQQITSLFTNLTHSGELEETTTGVSSLMDTWLLLLSVESSGERNRVFQLLKSRGMAHSNQMREFIITDKGIDMVDVYLGPGGVFTGAARLQQEAQEKIEALGVKEQMEHRRRVLDRKRQIMEAQVAALQTEISAEEEELQTLKDKSKLQQEIAAAQRGRLALARNADSPDSKEGE
ncbi:MAG: ATPase domain-containing protein, partial [Deltaproteobacteria bacterium]|nr:ATPase domain-containing protein [Deltaproteobacteria bacterium]